MSEQRLPPLSGANVDPSARNPQEPFRRAQIADAYGLDLTLPSKKQVIQGVRPLSGIPLGGLGTGSIEIRSDGALHEWQIFNNPPWGAGGLPGTAVPPSPVRPGDSLFAIKTRQGNAPPVIRILRQRDPAEANFAYILPYVGNVQEIRYTGEFPFALLEYGDPTLPVQVTLETWSSFIPGDVKHSALPAAVFTFRVTNPTPDAVEVSLLGIMPNAPGRSTGGGHPVEREEDAPGIHSLVFTADDVPPDHPMAGGSFAFSALADAVSITPSLPAGGPLGTSEVAVWDAWARGAPFNAGESAPDLPGMVMAGVAAGQIDPELIYSFIPSLVRGLIEMSLVPNPAEFQTRIVSDPIRYQNLAWRWALILELNLPADMQVQFVSEVAADPALRDDVSLAKTRLVDLGAGQHVNFMKVFDILGVGTPAIPRGAITRDMSLAPGASAQLTFVLSWFYPNHRGQSVGDPLGHRYEEWFDSAVAVARYVATNLDTLYARTRAFYDVQYSASAPYWLADAINAQLTTLVKSSWLVRDGRFGIWEGLGCCGLQTLDVSYYGSHAVTLFFPELEQRQLQMTADFQLVPGSPRYDEYFLAFPRNRELVQQRVAIDPSLATDSQRRLTMYREIAAETGFDAAGRIPHLFPGTFATVDAYHMSDLMPKFALQAWRDYQWTADLEALEKLWPHTKAAMEHTRRIDEAGVGLPYHYSHALSDTVISAQTYDVWDFAGYSAYVSSIWLAALKATARIASTVGDLEYAREMEQQFTASQASMERLLWNGEYYNLWVDPVSGRWNEYCMADQLSGQLYATLLGLGDILPREHLLSAFRAIFRYNRAEGRGLLNGALPQGKHADRPVYPGLTDPRLQSDTVWTGTEYAVAVQMILEGMVEEGMEVIRDVYERYERLGQTWDHQECGGHYYRAMCIWLAWPGLGGIRYDAPKQSLTITPVQRGTPWHLPLVLPGSWGSLDLDMEAGVLALHVQEGEQTLSRIALSSDLDKEKEMRVSLEKTPVESHLEEGAIVFSAPVRLVPGQSLEIRWR